MADGNNFDSDVDNYTITELLLILDLEAPITKDAVEEKTEEYIERFENENNNQMVDFFKNIQLKLKNYADELEEGDTAEYQPAARQTENWWKNQALEQDNPVQNDKITRRKQKIDLFNNPHLPMKREQLGVNNDFDVPVSQDSLNPNLKNITSRFINLDSQFRQPTSTGESSATDYTLELSEPLYNVLSMRLYSVQIPFSWYNVDVVHGTNCFWIVFDDASIDPINITLESGNYNAAEMADELNDQTSAFGNPNFAFDTNLPRPVTYSSRTGKITINLTGVTYNESSIMESKIVFFDTSGKLTCDSACNPVKNINQTLGWTMGYRVPTIIPDVNGDIGYAVVDSYGPRYLILTIDDFNQNHINNGLITITEGSTKIKMPDYYNSSLPTTCGEVRYGDVVIPDGEDATNQIDKLDNSFKRTQTVLPSAPRLLTQAQIYSINEIRKNNQNNTDYRIKAPTPTDTFALIPVKHGSDTGSMFIDFGGSLQDNKRNYFGPVNIERLRVRLQDDKGNNVNMNGANWSVTIICELLYQY